ncbi:XIAP-associated factor 1 [Cyclopterus lumpus]|uniref:XIAP associated factor 1 n=1 Tax=Cyclopterus lumpus TaxID=8103 RepID=A0A8C2ZKU4_CYCLU|nr:XIAP-associated factor 1 [Cyclopterus lumpus]
MGDEEATRSCGTCHKDVAEANFALHETHCRRFLCLCPDCDEPVPKEQLDQHREEQHTEVRCSKCHLKMERRHLVDHESDRCEERLQSCHYCQLELPHRDLDQHHVVCGSRTELCRDCNRYVTLRDRPGHGDTCSATGCSATGGSAPPPPPPPPPPQTAGKLPPNNTKSTATCGCCMASFPAADVEQHELECLLASKLIYEEEEEDEDEDEDEFPEQRATTWLSRGFQGGSLWDRPRGGTGAGAGDPDRISTCPHCHLALPVVTLRWHEVKCRIVINLR